MYNIERSSFPPEIYSQVAELAAEELNDALEAAANGKSSESDSAQTEDSIYNFNAILDAIGD